MIPAFDEHGYLPPGIHRATIDEVASRFGSGSELRRVQMESLRWLLELVRRCDVARVIINGSFTTDIFEPNDVDCALLIEPGFSSQRAAEDELVAGIPFLDINLLDEPDFELLVKSFFATDRNAIPKGVVEIIL